MNGAEAERIPGLMYRMGDLSASRIFAGSMFEKSLIQLRERLREDLTDLGYEPIPDALVVGT